MVKNPYHMLKYFLHNQFFLFRGSNTRNTISCSTVYHVKKPDFFLSWDHPFIRSLTIVSLKVSARGKPTTGCGLVLLYLMQIPHFSSKSLYEILILYHLCLSFAVNLIVFTVRIRKTVYGVLTQLFLYWINFLHYCKEMQHLT